MKKIFKNKIFIVTLSVIMALILLCAVLLFSVNAYVVSSAKGRILENEDAASVEGADCILILGCKVKSNGEPSDMLRDRLLCGIDLYKRMKEAGKDIKIIMSGDHGRADYNEVGTMKSFAIAYGVPSEDIFMDHAGFSTYESAVRAKEIFGVEKMIVVTQSYHLYRALFISERLGVEAYGVSADLDTYSGQLMRDIREILARNKDFIISYAGQEPTYLGERISLDQSGDVTNDN